MSLAEVASVLVEHPGRTARELRDVLRLRGRVSITEADVVRVLSAHPSRFQSEAHDPPRWWAATGPKPAVAGAPAPPDAVGLPDLYAWQVEALAAWRRRGGRGVVEAVTGTGKTMVGIAAAAEELERGGQVCVLVPTRELLRQWRQALVAHMRPDVSVGLLGGGQQARLADHDVLVAVVNSARTADLRPRRPGGLLVADECHRYAADVNRLALDARFTRRLGLSATYARTDDGHTAWLDPYFGGTCFRMGYRRAIDDKVMAPFKVALVGVAFTAEERDRYTELCLVMASMRARLVARHGVTPEPVGRFLQEVARLAATDDDGAGSDARSYLGAMQERRRLLAETPSKEALLGVLVGAIEAAGRSIVFTQTVAGAERAAARLRAGDIRAAAVHSRLDAAARRVVLEDFGAGRLQAVAAPQVLDEGVDVPEAALAVILAASRSRRQMVQRMGRVLRRKPGGGAARLAVIYVEETVEDPASGAHEGFLDEVTGVAEQVTTFAPGHETTALCDFLDPSSTWPAAEVSGEGGI